MFFKKKPAAGGVDFIIVGLGNPGAQYEQTRHNAGFIATDYIAEQLNARIKRLKYKSLYEFVDIGGKRVLLVQPHTFMNNSGEAVRQFMSFYKLPPERLLVICDDISLPTARLRIRKKGSDGGQKGMRSIISHIGSDCFCRIKIGVGEKPHPDYDLAAWVLSRFSSEEQQQLKQRLPDIYDAARLIVCDDTERAMNLYN